MSWGGVQGTQEGGGHSQGPGVSRSTKGELGAWLMQPFRGAGGGSWLLRRMPLSFTLVVPGAGSGGLRSPSNLISLPGI